MKIQGKPQWEFCCEWYGVNEIKQAIAQRRSSLVPPIPTDVYSHEFAEWLAHQYRLAMNKGIDLAQLEQQERAIA